MTNTADLWSNHPLYTPPEFWLEGLRTDDHRACMALLQSDEDRLAEVRRVFGRKQVAQVGCRALNLDGAGTLSQLQERIAEHPVVVFLLLAARFSVRKRRAAIEDVVRTVLSEDAQRECCHESVDGGIGEPDRIAALLRLYMADPQNLRLVWALHLWHSSSAASLVLDDNLLGVLPRQSLDHFVLFDPAFQGALRSQHARFEGIFPRGNGQWLIFVSRDYRKACMRVDGQLTHGLMEELVVLDFREGGRSVRVSSRSKPPPIALANAIATKFFGRPCTYGPDLATSAPPSVRAFMSKVLDRDDDTLPLVDIDVGRVPGLAGEPGVALYRANGGRMEEAVEALEEHFGDLTQQPDRIRRFDIRYDEAKIGLYVRRMGGELVVQFADGRTNNHRAERFQNEMAETYGIAVRSARTPKA